MNKNFLNILVLSLLTGCSGWYTKPDGERVNKNAPVFVSAPNTNKGIVNKPAESHTATSITFQAEKYVMVKESDLNALVEKKAGDRLKEIKSPVNPVSPNTNQPNTNKSEVNKGQSEGQGGGQSGEISPTVETLRLVPTIVEQKKPSVFMDIFAVSIVSLFVFGVIFTVYKKNKESNEVTAPKTPVIPKDPISATEGENSSNQTPPPATN